MGKLVDVQLWQSDAKAKHCSKCGSEQLKKACVKKCCKDKYKTVKLEKDQKVAERLADDAMHLTALAIPVYQPHFVPVYRASLVEEYPVCNAPPIVRKVDLHILNCLFRI
jgi:hypothetical protein